MRKNPPRWTGEDHTGRPFSDCEPEFLDVFAGFKAWCAEQEDKKEEKDGKGNPKSKWSRLDAARARGWAARIRGASRGVTRTSSETSRAPYVPKPAPVDGNSAEFTGDDSEIPF